MKEIKRRQNEPKMLQYQFAARYNFNKAEKINSALWIISIITALLAFFPSGTSWFIIIPLIFDILVLILCGVCNKAVQKAATFRSLFDDYVLGFNNIDISKEKRTQLNEIVGRTVRWHHTEAEIQMNNTGNDNPPGVKEWYEFPDGVNIHTPILFCQRQNMWWTNKMMIVKSILFVIEAIILIAFASFIILISDIPTLEKLICVLGFIIKTIDRVWAMGQYCFCCFKIIGAIDIQDDNCEKETLARIQGIINDLRNIPILGKNRLHQNLAKKLTESFKNSIEE